MYGRKWSTHQLKSSQHFLATVSVLLIATFSFAEGRDSEPSARETLDALHLRFAQAQQKFDQPYFQARTDEEREKIILDPAQDPIPLFVPRYVEFAEQFPGSAEAVEAWIFAFEAGSRSTRCTDSVHAAVDALIDSYRAHPALIDSIPLIHHVGPTDECLRLLRSLADPSSSREVRAYAEYGLARLEMLLPDPSLEVIRNRLQRIATEWGELAYHEDQTLGDRVDADLFELDHLSVGTVAPEIVGHDLDGETMRLSDYRGQVVLLRFWGSWCGESRSMFPGERGLATKFAERPVVFVGVNSDPNRQKVVETVQQQRIPGRSWWDGGSPGGAIARRWNVVRWPTIYVIDAEGVIRGANVPTLVEASRFIEESLAEGD